MHCYLCIFNLKRVFKKYVLNSNIFPSFNYSVEGVCLCVEGVCLCVGGVCSCVEGVCLCEREVCLCVGGVFVKVSRWCVCLCLGGLCLCVAMGNLCFVFISKAFSI